MKSFTSVQVHPLISFLNHVSPPPAPPCESRTISPLSASSSSTISFTSPTLRFSASASSTVEMDGRALNCDDFREESRRARKDEAE